MSAPVPVAVTLAVAVRTSTAPCASGVKAVPFTFTVSMTLGSPPVATSPAILATSALSSLV